MSTDNRRRFTYVSGSSLESGITFDFDYTGDVQEITLPKGSYKLQCWGAQGGGGGGKGGYSEGTLSLRNEQLLYVFVGGQGGKGSTDSLINGGWNGGGGSVGYCTYYDGYSCYPACGGGGTDICTVTSDMTEYYQGHNVRNSESLLSRFIVAGGGSGASNYTINTISYSHVATETYPSSLFIRETPKRYYSFRYYLDSGHYYKFTVPDLNSEESMYIIVYNNAGSIGNISEVRSYCSNGYLDITLQVSGYYVDFEATLIIEREEGEYDYGNSSGYAGGGVTGKGTCYGTQTGHSEGGSHAGGFGYGFSSLWDYCNFTPGGGGGGWYGGGGLFGSDTDPNVIYKNGSGSGFVNIPENVSYQPVGYSGLTLNSGTTIDGSQSFEAPGGGTETGHSGNGYVRITVL